MKKTMVMRHNNNIEQYLMSKLKKSRPTINGFDFVAMLQMYTKLLI